MYDITDIPRGTAPQLVKVFQLSPASETKSPGVAYDDRTLGELDAEDPVFLNACQSPTGKSGIMFNGAHSGTVSFWEFECTTPETACNGAATVQGSDANAGNDSSGSSLSGGAIAGIAIGSLIAVGAMKARSRGNVEMDTGKSDNGMEEPTAHTA